MKEAESKEAMFQHANTFIGIQKSMDIQSRPGQLTSAHDDDSCFPNI